MMAPKRVHLVDIRNESRNEANAIKVGIED